MCWSCLRDNLRRSHPLYIKTPFLAQHNSWHAVCLHNPQTGVYPLCVGTLGSLSMTLDVSVHLCNPQTRVCLLCAEVPSWLQPLVLVRYFPRIFFTLCTTLGVAICLHNSQTVVCLLCTKTCIFLSTTIGVVIRLRNHQTGVYLHYIRALLTLLLSWLPSWKLAYRFFFF